MKEKYKSLTALETCATGGCSFERCPYRKEENCKIKLIEDAGFVIATSKMQLEIIEHKIIKEFAKEIKGKVGYQENY